jgi:hypothetical protein
MMLPEWSSEVPGEKLGEEISRVEAVLTERSARAVRTETPGRVVGKAVVRVAEAAANFLRNS